MDDITKAVETTLPCETPDINGCHTHPANLAGGRTDPWSHGKYCPARLRPVVEKLIRDQLTALRLKLEKVIDALEWIDGACGAMPRTVCKCGRPNGIGALKSHAQSALAAFRDLRLTEGE